MGLLQRFVAKRSEASQQRFWAEVQNLMRHNETPINYAHLRGISRRENLRGTLYVTNNQVIWRIGEPGYPRGAGFQTPFADLEVVGRATDVPEPGTFALGIRRDGQVGAIMFKPQRPRDEASVLLAEAMFAASIKPGTLSANGRHRPSRAYGPNRRLAATSGSSHPHTTTGSPRSRLAHTCRK